MIRSILTILISLSFLTGFIGVKINSQCQECCKGQVCECGASFNVMELIKVDEPGSCCLSDHEGEIEAESCCHEKCGCCAYELVKLKVPLVIVSQSEKIELPVKNLTKSLFNAVVEDQAYRAILIINKIFDKPPPLTLSGLNLSCIFRC